MLVYIASVPPPPHVQNENKLKVRVIGGGGGEDTTFVHFICLNVIDTLIEESGKM